MNLGFYLDVRFPTDVSACSHCAEPTELRDLTSGPEGDLRCAHCTDRDDCVLCLNVELRKDLIPVPGLGWVCSNCVRKEARRLTRTVSPAEAYVC